MILHSPRALRLLYSFAALVVLGVTLLNFKIQMFERMVGNDQCRWVDVAPSRMLVTDIVPGGVAEQAGLRDGDIVLSINGEKFGHAIEAQLLINRIAGQRAVYLYERHGARFEAHVLILKSISLRFLAQFIYGLGFLLVGLVVVLVKPQGELQRAFGKFSILSMLFFGLTEISFDPAADTAWRIGLIMSSFIVATVTAPPVFVRFFLLFPVRLKGYDRRRLTVILYAVSILIAGGLLLTLWLKEFRPVTVVLVFLRYGFYFAGLGIFMRSYFAHVRPERRRALRPILVGVGLALVTFIFALAVTAINPFAAFLNPTILLPVMLLVVVPGFFGYAIFRYGLMDIDFVVQRTLTYGAVTMAMAAIYLAMVVGIGNLLTALFGTGDNRLIEVAALVVIAAAFEPLKNQLQRSVDRTFYRERTDYQQALLEFTEELPRLLDQRQILDALVNRISSTMHIDRLAVVMCDEKVGCFSAGKNVDPADSTFVESDRSLQALFRKTRRPQDFHLLAEELERYELGTEQIDKLRRAGVVLSVPMFLKDRLIGFINVGPKLSGNGYSREDVSLLSTVAAQAAIAIENARLVRSEREKERIHEELALARDIQRGLLPKSNPIVKGLDLAGISIPASSVGGDYYDFIQPEPDRLLVVVADVSGKGMSAALYMSKVQGMVQLAAHMYRTPREMLVHINRRIFEGMDRRSFITMILAQFDLRRNVVDICRAGHTKAAVSVEEKLELLEGSGIALGLERGPVFEEQIEEVQLAVHPGSLFVFYTDGITETMNEENQQMGEERMLELLQSSRGRRSLDIQNTVLAASDAFRGTAEQHDDITMVTVKGTLA